MLFRGKVPYEMESARDGSGLATQLTLNSNFTEWKGSGEAKHCYGVSKNCVRDWWKQKTTLEKMLK